MQNITIPQLISKYEKIPGGLMPLLHAIQDELGYIPNDVVPNIALGLNLSRAEVHGVITYYHFFRTTLPGKHVIQVCRAEACQACGAEELLSVLESSLNCKRNQTRYDEKITLEAVYCLGLCATSPAVQIDNKLYANVTTEKLKDLFGELEINP